jgi:hypothetical protein
MTLTKDRTTGHSPDSGRHGVAKRTVLGGKPNDAGTVDKELAKVAANLNAGRGASRGLPMR